MSDATNSSAAGRPGLAQRLLDWVERAGNKLPQPVTLFAIMIVIVLLASLLFSALGTSAVHPGTNSPKRGLLRTGDHFIHSLEGIIGLP